MEHETRLVEWPIKKVIDTLRTKGRIKLSWGYFIVTRLNIENFPDMPQSLVDQLKREGLYNGFTTYEYKELKEPPFSYYGLPVFGNPKVWVTKWFSRNFEGQEKQIRYIFSTHKERFNISEEQD